MMHLLVDLYEIESRLLEDEGLLRRTLTNLPALVGIRSGQGPFLAHITTSNPLDDGMSGLLLGDGRLHASLHAWPPYGMLNLDIFSAADFEPQDVFDWLHDQFKVDSLDMEINQVERAVRFTRHAPASV